MSVLDTPQASPTTTAASPTFTSDTVVSSTDYVIDVRDDPGGNEGMNEKSAAGRPDVCSTSPDGWLLKRWRRLSVSMSRPYIWTKHRKSDGRQKLVQRIDDHPRGYPQCAAFINSDENFLMCRKYGFLRNRVLLYRQDELAVLERNLIEMDDEDKEIMPIALQSRKADEERDEDEQYSRKTLIQKIDNKLKDYDDLVGRIQTYCSMKAPSKRDFCSFRQWIFDEKPLTPEEAAFQNEEHTDDFVALSSGQECGWLDGVVEDTVNWCIPSRLVKKLFTSHAQRLKTDDDYVRLVSKARIDLLVRLILTLTTVALLVGPSAVLFLVPGQSTLKICLIMVFTLLFSAAISAFTKAKRHEMLAATATYAAVLVVFLGNFQLTPA